jgi:DNA-binding transcriptional LysR family regulator
MPPFEWSDIPIFLTVAEAGSIAKAAKLLRISTATTSRRLEAMEDAIGHKLFDRLPNRLELTPAGRTLLGSADTMRNGANCFARAAASLSGRPAEQVRITATQSMSMFLIANLARLGTACTGTRLELVATRDQLSLARREADIALRMRHPPEAGDLVVRKLGQAAMSLYASRSLVDRIAADDKKFDIQRLPIIASMRDAGLSRQETWLSENLKANTITMRISETTLRRDAVVAGHGAALLPCFAGDGMPNLVRILEPPEELVEDAYVLIHKDMKDVPEIRMVANALAALFKAEARRLRGDIVSRE